MTSPAESASFLGTRVLFRTKAHAGYAVRLATTHADLIAVQSLRFQVFNLELRQGLAASYAEGLDADRFDKVCDHLLVQREDNGEVIGTYRLQTGTMAAAALGFYSEQEFDFTPYRAFQSEIIELGRACIHHEHRNRGVLTLLWKAIADYARTNRGRYMVGCSSIDSQDPAEGAAAYAALAPKHLARPELRTFPLPALACPLDRVAERPQRIPRLLLAYLSLGAKICAPPAIDREFKSIDFLTLMDMADLPEHALERILA